MISTTYSDKMVDVRLETTRWRSYNRRDDEWPQDGR
jgi:hypothetical protein